MNRETKKIIRHRLLSSLQLTAGLLGLPATLIWILPSGRTAAAICLILLCFHEILMGAMNLFLTTKKSYDKLLRPCNEYLHDQKSKQTLQK